MNSVQTFAFLAMPAKKIYIKKNNNINKLFFLLGFCSVEGDPAPPPHTPQSQTSLETIITKSLDTALNRIVSTVLLSSPSTIGYGAPSALLFYTDVKTVM